MRLLAYIGVGSNLNDPVAQVHEAIEALGAIPDSVLIARSSLYRSKAMGGVEQPDYVNAVVSIHTALAPLVLLQALQAIERQQGRERTGEKWGPRVLDLDLLLYGNRIITTAELTLPHPGLHQRDFVLVPLEEIAGDIEIPGQGMVRAHLPCCESHSLRKLGTV
jgi:2-amino-4-hydroxy-6-hydroxymethyldihydropteridine diphosphokinase